MAKGADLPVDIFQTKHLRGLSPLEKNLWLYLHNTSAAGMSGFFAFEVADIAFFLECDAEDVGRALLKLTERGAAIHDGDHVFLPNHAELTGSAKWNETYWANHLRFVISGYHGPKDSAPWQAFQERFRERIERIAPKPAKEAPPALAGVISPAVSSYHAPAGDDLSKLIAILESGIPDEALANGIVKAKTSQFERGWIAQFYQGYGYERVAGAIEAVLAKGWKGKPSKEKVKAALDGTLDSFFDEADRRRNAPVPTRDDEPVSLKIV